MTGPGTGPGALARALRGPLLLTTFGTLLAIDLGGGPGVTSTWPVLVIVFGLFKLAEASLQKASDVQPGGAA